MGFEIDKATAAKITAATLQKEPSLRQLDQGQILLAQGFLRGHLAPGEEIDIMTDDRISCDGLLLLTVQPEGEADYTFVHLVEGDPYREATIQLVEEAIASHPEGARFAVLATSHSFGSGTILQGTNAVFEKLTLALRTFVGNGRLDIRAVDREIVHPTSPYDLRFRRTRQENSLYYELSIGNTDFSLRFLEDQAQALASRPGTTKIIPDTWD